MNDFTIDELNLLIYYIGLTMDKRGLDLSVKIKSIIDNYCEHEYDFDSTESIKCKHCDKLIIDEPY